MFKRMLLAAGIAASMAFAGCSTTAQQHVSTVAVNINTQVNKACGVFEPVALDAQLLYSLDPKVDPKIVQGVGNALTLANIALNLWVASYVPPVATAPAQ